VASLDPSVALLSVEPHTVTLDVVQAWRTDRPRSLALSSFVRQAASMLSSTKYSPRED